MRGSKVRKLAILITVGALVAQLVKKLRGDPAPQFSNHPTVKGGPSTDPIRQPTPAARPAPQDPTAPASGTTLVAAPEDPTVPEDDDAPPAAAAAPPASAPVATTPLAASPVAAPPVAAPPVAASPVADTEAGGSGEQTWLAPVDGACPDGYPIKAKVKSGIYHQPGGTAYERTSPDRCYSDAAAAEADGLRAAKR
jgi:hypothetical protein